MTHRAALYDTFVENIPVDTCFVSSLITVAARRASSLNAVIARATIFARAWTRPVLLPATGRRLLRGRVCFLQAPFRPRDALS